MQRVVELIWHTKPLMYLADGMDDIEKKQINKNHIDMNIFYNYLKNS